MNKHIKKWSEKLLDLTKRNNLISFKDTKASTADVLYPNIVRLFNMINEDKSLDIYEEEISNEQLNELGELISISKDIYLDIHVKKLNNNHMLLFKDKNTTNKIVKNIHKKNNEFFQEKGLNITHLSFGFINWIEDDYTYKAPILLTPVTLSRKSSVDPYVIKKIDDVILNQTFKFKLKVEYNIDLEEYNPKQSLKEYFEYIEEIVSKLKWTISREVKLSNLPFSKINMYNDLIDNEEIILNNPVINNLFNPTQTEYSELEEVLIENHKQLNVVSADGSQMRAIDLALKGESFVLEGPPGTGKSQTITNIIGALLNEGKKVLFVSEKKAALDVVFNNLKKVNLEQFCIPLHGTKLNKKDFINDIYDTMCLGRQNISSDSQQYLDKFKYLEQNLDKYSIDLHKNNEKLNLSLFSVMSKLLEFDEYDDVEYIINNIEDKEINNIIINLDKIKNYFNTYSNDFTNHYFYGIKYNELSYQFNIELKKELENIINISNNLNIDPISNYSVVNLINYIELKELMKEYNLNNNTEFINNIEYYLNNMIELSNLSNEINELEDVLLNTFKNDVLELDGISLYEEIEYNYSSAINRIFSSNYKQIRKRFELNLIEKNKLSYKDLLKYTEILKNYNKLVIKYNELDKIDNLKISKYNKIKTNWNLFITNITFIKDNINLITKCSNLINLNKGDELSNEIISLNNSVTNELYFNEINKFKINELSNKFNDIITNFDKLSLWMNFLKELDISKELEIYDFIISIKEKNLDYNKMNEYYLKTYYLQCFDLMAKDTRIQCFDSLEQDRYVSSFKQTDEDVYKISRDKIISKLSNNRPNVENKVPGSPSSILAREHEKKSRVKTILNLMTEIPQFIQEIKPCFLMSPLAVATYLNPKNCEFDVTIFDEASQIFPFDAVGAIYRSKQTIVVGDSKQMPPTNFFNSNTSEEEIEEDESDVDAFESILDLFKSSFPSRRLLWHYRSKVESLISFSNDKYYNNSLISFPTTFPNEENYGVDFHFVEDGIYSPNDRVNVIEAQRVVDLVFKHINEFPNRSLGVIAFNQAQQDKIESILEKRRIELPDHEEFFNKTKEPFFIKNLETVQGDERDTILFSICFGKNNQGVFRQNFGPLSLLGGERRLNVAVTRAKYNLKVISSIKATDINISNVKHDGPKHLRAYLDFAQNGLIALDKEVTVNSELNFDSYFEEDVYNFLVSKGFDVDTQVGCSKYKIDLALKDGNSSNYYLAIECDGASYHSSKSTRDRDKLRQSVLENMRWKFYRIWSTDWFKNNKNAKEKLLEYITNVKNNTIVEEVQNKSYVSKLEVVNSNVDLFTEYKFCNIDNINSLKRFTDAFSDKINEWVKIESPLSVDTILKKVCINFHSEKVTLRVKEDFLHYYKKDKEILYKDGFFYLENTINNKLRVITNNKREIETISKYELANGLYAILDSITQCDKENLFKYITKELGYKSVSIKSVALLDKAFVLLKPFVHEENGIYTINKTIDFKLN